MNLSSKLSLFFLILFSSDCCFAINLTAIYTSACVREVGVIIQVSDGEITLLKTDGQLKKFHHYEVIYLAQYPMDRFRLSGPADARGIDRYRVRTVLNNQLVELVEGWPIGYTSDKISFLTTLGLEIIVDRKDIVELEKVPTTELLNFTGSSSSALDFVHPYAFRECPIDPSTSGKQKTYPQEVLSEPVSIKRNLDEMAKGQARLEWYHREQQFYPVPFIYGNKTSLGIWQSFGSRYGQGGRRTSDFTPVLTDETASDIFDYQYKIVTGSAPMLFADHEEPQTQSYYAFKASYFHFAGMFDPNLILIGDNYSWQASDFKASTDDRVSTSGFAEIGFDYGHWALHLILVNIDDVGVSVGSTQFSVASFNVPKLGLSYQNRNFYFDIAGGTGTATDTTSSPTNAAYNLTVARINARFHVSRKLELTYSLIDRNLKLSGAFNYSSRSLTNSMIASYALSHRLDAGGYLSVESHTISANAGTDISSNKIYPKASAFIALSF